MPLEGSVAFASVGVKHVYAPFLSTPAFIGIAFSGLGDTLSDQVLMWAG